MNHSEQVRQYYEKNTRRFLSFHSDAQTKSIHQPLWAEAGFSLERAINYSNELILQEVRSLLDQNGKSSITIADLGCGVGSSLFYLSERLSGKSLFYGVSISRTQIEMAQKRAESRPEMTFIEGDFLDLPKDLPEIDIAFSIEAFAHAASAERYFEQVGQKLKPGGRLILIDDFLNDAINAHHLAQKDKQHLEDFQYGWLIGSLKKQQELNKIATGNNLTLISSVDLTPYFKIYTLKNKWIRFWVTLLRPLYDRLPFSSPYFQSWIGGNGKQHCLQKGIIQYKMMVFEKMMNDER